MRYDVLVDSTSFPFLLHSHLPQLSLRLLPHPHKAQHTAPLPLLLPLVRVKHPCLLEGPLVQAGIDAPLCLDCLLLPIRLAVPEVLLAVIMVPQPVIVDDEVLALAAGVHDGLILCLINLIVHEALIGNLNLIKPSPRGGALFLGQDLRPDGIPFRLL